MNCSSNNSDSVEKKPAAEQCKAKSLLVLCENPMTIDSRLEFWRFFSCCCLCGRTDERAMPVLFLRLKRSGVSGEISLSIEFEWLVVMKSGWYVLWKMMVSVLFIWTTEKIAPVSIVFVVVQRMNWNGPRLMCVWMLDSEKSIGTKNERRKRKCERIQIQRDKCCIRSRY